MIKARFGDHIRSKTDTAMTNEALCKVLCHNICRLIPSQYEPGIVPISRKDEPVEPEPVAATPAPDPMEVFARM